MLKLAVMVSGGGTNLQAIIDSIEGGFLKNVEIVLVVSSNPDALALKRAKRHGLNHITVTRQDYESGAEFENALISPLLEKNVDLVITAGYLKILPDRFIDTYIGRIINVHPSLIPSFSGDGFYGLKVHEAALEKGVKVTGATVHFVNRITDSGPIILQRAVEVLENDTPLVLQKRVMEQAEWKLLPEAIRLFSLNRLKIENNKVYVIPGADTSGGV